MKNNAPCFRNRVFMEFLSTGKSKQRYSTPIITVRVRVAWRHSQNVDTNISGVNF